MTPEFRQEILRVAQAWIGTPYQHQSSAKGQGADCLGLLRGIWREVVGDEPETMPPYTADWSEVAMLERLWDGAARHLTPVNQNTKAAGDVVLFRMRSESVAKHLAVLGDGEIGYPTIIHAYSGVGVVETPLTQAWTRRIVAQFEFPDRRG